MEPLTLAAVGGMVLAEGVKFLYGQATELIRYWRERRDAKEGVTAIEPTASPPADLLTGQLAPLIVDHAALDRLQNEIRDLRSRLLDYVEGSEPITSDDKRLLLHADGLRRLLEAVYQQRFTFIGEHREASGPLIHGRVDVDEVAGYAAAVRVEALKLASGSVLGEVRAGRVAKDGEVVGLDIGTAENR
jgi:hypothetical protein